MPIDVPRPSAELESWLAENREPLIRRWLELVVERSSLEELARRPLSERIRELDLLLEAARGDGAGSGASGGPALADACRAAIDAGRPFALVLLAPPPVGPAADEWTRAVAEVARDEQRVAPAAGGLTAVVVPSADEGRARIEADRLRAGAWQRLGGDCLLPDVSIATFPTEATDPAALTALARDRLPGAGEAVTAIPTPPPPAPVATRPATATGDASEGETVDLWRELASRRRRDDDGPPAAVTPLYPPQE